MKKIKTLWKQFAQWDHERRLWAKERRMWIRCSYYAQQGEYSLGATMACCGVIIGFIFGIPLLEPNGLFGYTTFMHPLTTFYTCATIVTVGGLMILGGFLKLLDF